MLKICTRYNLKFSNHGCKVNWKPESEEQFEPFAYSTKRSGDSFIVKLCDVKQYQRTEYRFKLDCSENLKFRELCHSYVVFEVLGDECYIFFEDNMCQRFGVSKFSLIPVQSW